MTESTKKIRKTTITIQTIFCSLTVILTVLYVLDIQSGINLTTVNVLCFSFYFTQLAPGLLECNNHQKAQWLLAAVFISAIVTSLNLWIDYRTVNEFHLSVLSGWCFTWIILLLTASVSTISILIRLFRWSQEQWEEIRKMRQQHRQKTKESWIKYFTSRNTHRLEMQDLAQRQRKEIRENKQKNRLEGLSIKSKLHKKRLFLKFFKVVQIKKRYHEEFSPHPDMHGHIATIKIQVKRVILALFLCALGSF